ncbi:16S rRNA (cytosine(967)-C(5))-methyltransferase [Bacillus sp. M6-12]|uniref:16S rRNA (cytosine(967)-C(5))-methyltransferase RsmB n=1 Tax=Bacillus sp. M6-12 TaxID=2054166 RepID=UPI000C757BA4|nr:16S rRNA (cytosine(967)-C(5))-methyltransferase RsmB [Bacillus sp. M6-12]PLS16632.1 16S rRNA (cytosine(967)-C(5))-methyltransferase [Bacillus sp. M6-12]
MASKKKGIREIALDILQSVEKNQSYSNLLLNTTINKYKLSQADSGLLTELTYGTLQRKMTLDYFLEPFLGTGKKIEGWVTILLRLSVYQMAFLDKIPDHAILFEAVEIAKKRGHKGIAAMVNGVLRNIQRKGLPSLDEIKDDAERLAITTSHPTWLVRRWIKQFGYEKTEAMCELNLHAPVQTARVNKTILSRKELISRLEEEGFFVEPSPVIHEAVRCLKGNLAHSHAYKEGFLTIQDESSMLVAYALGAKGDDLVLDSCSAPGGKTTHIAEGLSAGKVIALDLHEHKVKLVAEQAERLQLNNIETRATDSRKAGELFEQETFDKVLVDAPCSGLGVMRRKPDLKYTKTENDITRLSSIQQTLLEASAPLLKREGILVYSTCTVDKEENDRVAEAFLSAHPDFEPDLSLANRMPQEVQPFVNQHTIQIFPQDFGSDGFYIACFRKKV